MDAEPAPITIEAPAPPPKVAAPASLPAPPAPGTTDTPAPSTTESTAPATPAPPTTAPSTPPAAPPKPAKSDAPGPGRASSAYYRGEGQIHDSGFASARERPAPETELGVGTFLVSGATASGVVGGSPFFSREVSPGVIIRPAISIAGTEAAQFRATWTAARVDACWRFPPEAPVQLDLCGGAELGFVYVASGKEPGSPAEGHTLATFDVGPTAALRSEIGRDVAVALRAGAGVNATRSSYTDVTGTEQQAPIVSARFEVALSWLLR